MNSSRVVLQYICSAISMVNFLFLLASLFLVIKSAAFAIRHSSRLAEGLRVSKYVVGFLIVAVISVLPEAFIAITSALQGTPEFGLGTLFGSNVADLTLIFGIVILTSSRRIRVESKVIKNSSLYVAAIAAPIIFGLNGYYSRIEGSMLIIIGLFFYLFLVRKDQNGSSKAKRYIPWKSFLFLIFSIGILMLASFMTVKFGVSLARDLRITPVLIGMFVVGLSTTLPELFFSIKAIKSRRDGLAIGDILGTVITDATIVIGLLAVIKPFTFDPRITYVTGIFMIFVAALLMRFMKTGRALTRWEGLLLILSYAVFVWIEFAMGGYPGFTME